MLFEVTKIVNIQLSFVRDQNKNLSDMWTTPKNIENLPDDNLCIVWIIFNLISHIIINIVQLKKKSINIIVVTI